MYRTQINVSSDDSVRQRIVSESWFLTGPTASGKSRVAIELASRLGGEIVSLDSMAVYRGLDIGTAKPSSDDRQRVPHHLLDIVDIDEEFSLAQYVEQATTTALDILDRGRAVVFVGGTPLYLKAMLRGIFEGPPADWDLRHRWQFESQQHDDDWLHAKVAEIDPASARKLHARDTRRLIRVLEVFAKTGRPMSELQQQFDRARSASDCRVFVLDWPREVLFRRIDERVDRMFADGLVDEVRGVLATGRTFGRTAGQAVGYREVLKHFASARDLAATIELVKTRTRQLAKRQLTWFRSLSECTPISMTGQGSDAVIHTMLAKSR